MSDEQGGRKFVRNKRTVILRTLLLVWEFRHHNSHRIPPQALHRSTKNASVLQSVSLGQLTPPKWSSVLLTARSLHGRLFWRTSKENLTSGSHILTRGTPMFSSATRQKYCLGGICAYLYTQMA